LSSIIPGWLPPILGTPTRVAHFRSVLERGVMPVQIAIDIHLQAAAGGVR
jgi:hypothetical protein